MSVSFVLDGAGTAIKLWSPKVVVVGFSGRDDAAVRRHIDELALEGIEAPSEVPHVWEFDSGLLTQGDTIDGRAGATSGEAEPVLILTQGAAFVGVGSDHTDRHLERTSLDDAKAACKKVVSRECWPLDAVRARWDSLRLEARTRRGDGWVEYQRSTLADILPVDWFLDRFSANGDAVVFCGTVPTLDGMDTSATGFEAALSDPESGRRLRCRYDIRERVAHG